MGFKQATKEQAYLTVSIEGASGSGKTYTAQEIAKYLCPPGKKIYHIDSERGSASKYAHLFDFLVDDDFGPTGKVNYHPDVWIKKMQGAVAAGDCGVLVLDSLTHLWKGEGGVLSVIEQIKKTSEAKGKKADGFNAWQDGDRIYRRFMDALLSLPCHRIFTLRSKTKYEKKQNDKGYMEVQKLGLEAEYRDGYEFEVDVQCLMTQENTLVPMKQRVGPALNEKVFPKPGQDFATILLDWATAGAPPAPVAVATDEAVAAAESSTELVKNLATPASPTTVLLAQIEAAQTEGDLKAVSEQIKIAIADKKITLEDRNGVLSPAYMKRSKELKAAA